jgi:hypothetical protein
MADVQVAKVAEEVVEQTLFNNKYGMKKHNSSTYSSRWRRRRRRRTMRSRSRWGQLNKQWIQ